MNKSIEVRLQADPKGAFRKSAKEAVFFRTGQLSQSAGKIQDICPNALPKFVTIVPTHCHKFGCWWLRGSLLQKVHTQTHPPLICNIRKHWHLFHYFTCGRSPRQFPLLLFAKCVASRTIGSWRALFTVLQSNPDAALSLSL